MKNTVKLVTIMVALSVTSVFATDWPWIYGPKRDHTSDQKGLLRTWPEAGPKVLWTVPVGAGFGGPAVSGGNVYLLDRDEKVGDTLRVLELASGKELWTFAYDAPGTFMFAGSRTTPTVDGEHVYTVGPMGDLYAINTKTQKPAWRKNIWKDFGGERPTAAVGDRAESVDLRRSADRGAADVGGRCRGLRQADRRDQMEVCRPVRHSGVRAALHRQGGRRGSSRRDHRRRWTRPHRQGRERQRSRSTQRQGAVDLHRLAVHHPGSAGGRRRSGPAAHHGRLQRRLGDDQGGQEGGHLRGVRVVQES